MKLIEFPGTNVADIPARLRDLASAIEEGNFGDAHGLAWVIDCGDGRCEVGYLGHAPGIAGADAHLLLAIGQRKLEEPSLG